MVLEGLKTFLELFSWLSISPVQQIFGIGAVTALVGGILGSWFGFVLFMLTFFGSVYVCRNILERESPCRSDDVMDTLLEMSRRSRDMINNFASIFFVPVDINRIHSGYGEEPPLSPRDTWSGIGIIEEELDKFIELVIRDFVRSWYDPFHGSKEVLEDFRRILKSSGLDITRRLSRADTRQLTCDVVEMYTHHLGAVMASLRAQKQQKTEGCARVQTLEEVFDKRFHLHHALGSEESERCYVTGVARLVLSAVVPRNVVACRSVERVLVQIISLNIILSIINKLSSSDWIYEKVIIITCEGDGYKLLNEVLNGVLSHSGLKLRLNERSCENQSQNALPGTEQTNVNAKPQMDNKSGKETNKEESENRNEKGACSLQEEIPPSDEVFGEVNTYGTTYSEKVCMCTEECDCAWRTKSSKDLPCGRRTSADEVEVEDVLLNDPRSASEKKCHISVSCDRIGESDEKLLEEELSQIAEAQGLITGEEKSRLATEDVRRRSRSVSPHPRPELHVEACAPPMVRNCTQPDNLHRKNCHTELFKSSLRDVNRDNDPLAMAVVDAEEEGLTVPKTVAFSISDDDFQEYTQLEVPLEDGAEMPVPIALSGEGEVTVPLTDSTFIFQDVNIAETEMAQEYRSSTVYTLYVVEYEALHFSDKGPVLRSGTVKRRYREFVNLLSRLEENTDSKKLLKDVKGPSRWRSMPFKNLDKESIEARRVFLETFLKTLISKEALCNGPEMREFLAYEGDSHIAFVKKPQEKTRFDKFVDLCRFMWEERPDPEMKVIVRTVSGMFDKLKTSLPSLPQELPTLPFLDRPIERREASPQHHDPDNLAPQFSLRDSQSSAMGKKLGKFVLSTMSGLQAGEITKAADSNWQSPLVAQLPRIQGDGSETPDQLIFEGLWLQRQGLELSDAVLDLAAQAWQDTGTWLVKERSLQVIRTCLGMALDRWLEEQVKDLTTREECHGYLVLLRESIWPNGVLADEDLPVKTAEQREATRQCAKECLRKFLPGLLRLMVGDQDFEEALEMVINSVQSEKLCRHLAFQLLDLAVERFFPEISSQDLQKIVLSR